MTSNDSPPRPPAAPLPRHPATAVLAGWILVALVDVAAAQLLLPAPRGGFRVRGVQLLYVVGYDLAIGLLLASVAEAWARWGPKSSRAARVAPAVATILVAALLVARDVESFASRLPGPVELWIALLALAFGAGAAVAMLLVRRFAIGRPRSAAALVLGLALAMVNHLVLVAGYAGVHLVVAWIAAVFAGIGLLGVGLDRVRIPPAAARVARAVAALAAAVAIALAPSMTVMVELLRLPGHAPARFVGELRARLQPSWAGGAVAGGAGEWWVDRSNKGPIAPSRAIQLPADAVVVLVTVDALRADVVNSGKHDDVLPNLARLRDSSVVFTEARSPASATAPSMGSLFSGKYYSQLYWSEPKKRKIKSRDGTSKVFLQDDPTVRFPAALGDGGVATLNLPGTGGFSKDYGLISGFAEEEKPGWGAAELIGAAVARAKKKGPTFIYLHCMEPHEGYDAPGKTPYERYIGEVKKVDAALQPLVDLTESPELRDRLVVILSADHGEAFGEHGTKFHTVTLYEELIRVPLFVHIPGVKPRRDDTPVAGMDIGPTVLDLFGVPIPGSNMGQSLAPLIAGKGARTLTRPLVADSGRRMQAMIFDGRYKVIRDLRQGTVELYDLKDDPGELKNLSDEKPELTKDLHGRMASFFDVHTYRKKGYEVPYRP